MEKKYLSIIATSLLTAVFINGCTPYAQKKSPSPYYKVGSPYQIKGTWYYPHKDEAYTETGVASWYGKQFHGKKTANGDVFNLNDLTAAHRTLPLPSMVKVTNLENGRSITLMVNDRGPFAKNRIIDVSKRAARILGFQHKGTTKVRVDYLPESTERLLVNVPGSPYYHRIKPKAPEPIQLANEKPRIEAAGPQLPIQNTPILEEEPPFPMAVSRYEWDWENFIGPRPYLEESIQHYVDHFIPEPTMRRKYVELAPEPVIRARESFVPLPQLREEQKSAASLAETAPIAIARPTVNHFIRVGSFRMPENAEKVNLDLKAITESNIIPSSADGVDYHRVQVGPVETYEVAQNILQKIISKGYVNAMIVSE